MPPDAPAAPRVLAPPALGAPPRPRVPAPERWTLANGLRVVAIPRGGIPQIAIRVVIPAGSVADPAEYPGTAGMVGALLTEGTAGYDAEALNARIDALGAAVHVHAGHDFAEVEMTLLSGTLEEGLPLLAELVTRPTFPEDETERVRAETLDALAARTDEPANVADDRCLLEVFGEGHPYGRPPFGTEEGVAGVPREALAAFHAERYRPGGSFLVAAGDFDPAALRALLEGALAGWTGEATPPLYPPAPPVPARAGERVRIPWEDSAQGEIRVAGVGMTRSSPDWIPAAVANYILGGSTILGRLGANLREEKGWTYGVRSAFSAGIAPGGWVTETAVGAEVAEDAVREIHAEMRRMTEEPVDDDELRRARDALVLSLLRAFETPPRVASRFSTLEAYGLPHDYWERFPERVEAVTPGEILRVAREHFDPERVVTVTVGGEEGAERAARETNG
ncbi:MAG TPA: pitrilysin family protein [Longimicrobiaceae bacterium]|nr:pitrilysin family protein [Longimicrobiaceae bacterium]